MELSEEILDMLSEDRNTSEILAYGFIIDDIFYTLSMTYNLGQKRYRIDIYQYRPKYEDLVSLLYLMKIYNTQKAARLYIDILKVEVENGFRLV